MNYPLTINNATLSSTKSDVTITIDSRKCFTINRLRENKLPEQTHFRLPSEEKMLAKLDSLTEGKEVTNYISMRVSTLSKNVEPNSVIFASSVFIFLSYFFYIPALAIAMNPKSLSDFFWGIGCFAFFSSIPIVLFTGTLYDYKVGRSEEFQSKQIITIVSLYILGVIVGIVFSKNLIFLVLPLLMTLGFYCVADRTKESLSDVDRRLQRLFFLKHNHNIYTTTLSKAKCVDELLCLAKADKLFFIQAVEQELDFYISHNNAIMNNVTESLNAIELSHSAQVEAPTYVISNENNLVDLLSSVGLAGTANSIIVPMYEMFSEQELNSVFNGQLEQKIEALRDLIQLYANSKELNSEAIHNQSHELKLLIIDSAQNMFIQAEEEYVNKMSREIEDAKALFNKCQ